jgi:UDP-N-acetylmuramoyl-tripeptide--D-alanyl-D-alanine ligase
VSLLVVAAATVVAVVLADLRWLRVAQREHYYAARPFVVATIWNRAVPVNLVLLGVAVAGLVAGLWVPLASLVGVVAAVIWPWGLPVRGTTRPLVWTQRVVRLTVVLVALDVAWLVGFALLGWTAAVAALVLAAPVVVGAALAVATPVERALANRFVASAAARIAQVRPTVVGITGSYGKTSTKGYTAHLLAGQHAVVASPASFNNLLGLARAVNERLVPGTDVFVAEMGTYGPGEIRQLCQVFPPEVAAITTIGEAHLERMGSKAVVAAAKAEIAEPASTVVLNVDVPELAALADALPATKTVIRTATDPQTTADVHVVPADGQWQVIVDQAAVATVPAPPGGGHPGNLAVAVGVARAMQVAPSAIAGRLAGLPTADHRAEVRESDDGILVVDDTYNSNPSGAAASVRLAVASAGETGRVFVVTPGMVELGRMQAQRNRELAAQVVSSPRTTLAVVGRTNRAALLAGAPGASTFASRSEATRWVTTQAQAGDVILFENDLPDHYP